MNVIYYADPTAADQGASGTRTIKGLITAIGGTKNATIVLAHNSNSTNTTYTIGTSTTISANINLKVEPGALISVSSGKTLTVNGPVDAGLYKIFTGSGTITGLKIAELAWFGFDASAVAATNDAAITKALASSLYVSETRAGTFSISSTITINTAYQILHLGGSVYLSYSGTSAAIKFDGIGYAKVTGLARITCTSTSGSGVLFDTTNGNAIYNNVDLYWIQGAGRGAAPDTNTGVGIEFERQIGSNIAYYNKVRVHRIMDWNICVLFDAVNGTSGEGGNANIVEDAICDTYWKAFKFRSIENMILNCSGWGSAGSGSDYTYLLWFENSAYNNSAFGVSGEPGALSSAYYIASGCTYNTIVGSLANFPIAATNLDTTGSNFISDGRSLSLPDGHIRFPATNVVSTNANTLDDYAEGSWTAAFACGTSGTVTISNSYKTGTYTKVGRLVTICGRLQVDSVSSPVGTLTVSGLPFTCITGDSFCSAINVRADTLEATGTTTITGYVVPNTKTFVLSHFTAGASAAMAADCKAGSDFVVSGFYYTEE